MFSYIILLANETIVLSFSMLFCFKYLKNAPALVKVFLYLHLYYGCKCTGVNLSGILQHSR